MGKRGSTVAACCRLGSLGNLTCITACGRGCWLRIELDPDHYVPLLPGAGYFFLVGLPVRAK